MTTPTTPLNPNTMAAALPRPGWMATTGYWLVPLLTALVGATTLYGLLPLLGLCNISQWFSLNKLALLPVGLVGLLLYSRYCGLMAKHPWWLVFFMLLVWPTIDCINEQLLILGINIKLRPLIGLILGFPGFWCMVANHRALFALAPQLKWYLAFFAWLSLYFCFNTAELVDPKLMIEGAQNSGSIALMQYVAYYYLLVGIGVAAVAVQRARAAGVLQSYFDRLNTALIGVSTLMGVYTIVGYPFLLTSKVVDGFQRAFGIYTHPNAMAHHMGLLMIYMLGLFLYYQGANHRRISPVLLGSGLIIGLIAFLLSLSKSAIAMAAIGAVVVVLMNASSSVVRKHLPGVLASLVIVVPLGMVMYALISDQNLFEVLEARLNATDSLDWRVEIWGYLMSQIDMGTVWLGHGFTDANQWVFQLTYNTETNAKPLIMVHNGYIALLYDLGLMGYTYFAAVLAVMGGAFSLFRKRTAAHMKPLASAAVAMGVYFLAICAGDEMTYMFDAPLLFWVLATTVVAYGSCLGKGKANTTLVSDGV